MTGKVHIANVSESIVVYTLNGKTIEPAARPMNPATCAPCFVLASRSGEPGSPGAFASGRNSFVAAYRDTIPFEQAQSSYDVTIPASVPLDDDLIVYLFRNAALLMTTQGLLLADQPLAYSGNWPDGPEGFP